MSTVGEGGDLTSMGRAEMAGKIISPRAPSAGCAARCSPLRLLCALDLLVGCPVDGSVCVCVCVRVLVRMSVSWLVRRRHTRQRSVWQH